VTQVPEAAPAAADAEALPEPSRQGGAQNGNHGAKA
jgi:hypothetical protein